MSRKEKNIRNPLTPARAPWPLLLARLFGCLPNPLSFFLNCATQYGDIVDLTLEPRTYLLNNPEDIRYVLEVNHLNYTFSVDLLGEAKDLADAMTVRRRYIQPYFRVPCPLLFPGYLPPRTNRAYRRAMLSIDQTIHRMVRTRRESAVSAHDLFSLLMQARDQDGATMDDTQVRDEALTIATTGYETIELALAWTWYLLLQNPAVERKLTVELQTVLGGRRTSVADVSQLRYTDLVLSEGMRLYPPTWNFVRVSQHADVLPSGIRIPTGTKLYLCLYAMQRNPCYCPEPERLDLEQFSESAKQSRPRFAYFPFAGGPRVCLGQGFALLDGVLVLACLARHVRLEVLLNQRIMPTLGLPLFPQNVIHMRVTHASGQ